MLRIAPAVVATAIDGYAPVCPSRGILLPITSFLLTFAPPKHSRAPSSFSAHSTFPYFVMGHVPTMKSTISEASLGFEMLGEAGIPALLELLESKAAQFALDEIQKANTPGPPYFDHSGVDSNLGMEEGVR